jgi:surface antigen
MTNDNYNLGIKYQCVEFVKRYYYEHLHHKMPDSYGHAKDLFDKTLSDGQLNSKRNLHQYKNGSTSKPATDDIIAFSGTWYNRFGHVAIISNVWDDSIEIMQQNPGPRGKSRKTFLIHNTDGKWIVRVKRVLGWLRKE